MFADFECELTTLGRVVEAEVTLKYLSCLYFQNAINFRNFPSEFTLTPELNN